MTVSRMEEAGDDATFKTWLSLLISKHGLPGIQCFQMRLYSKRKGRYKKQDAYFERSTGSGNRRLVSASLEGRKTFLATHISTTFSLFQIQTILELLKLVWWVVLCVQVLTILMIAACTLIVLWKTENNSSFKRDCVSHVMVSVNHYLLALVNVGAPVGSAIIGTQLVCMDTCSDGQSMNNMVGRTPTNLVLQMMSTQYWKHAWLMSMLVQWRWLLPWYD